MFWMAACVYTYMCVYMYVCVRVCTYIAHLYCRVVCEGSQGVVIME